MPTDCVSYENSGYFTRLMTDYLNQKDNLQSLYENFPTIENFESQIAAKKSTFPMAHRNVLKATLLKQYQNTPTSEKTLENVQLLEKENTFTVVTGHQLNLFTGPLYFVYKIISTIKTCQVLSEKYPENQFVPIYWMATEDHDFEEINHFKHGNTTLRWETKSGGPVGKILLENMDGVFASFRALLGAGNAAKELEIWFEKAYLQHDNLAEATRYLANELFKSYGLVIVDGDDASFKKLMTTELEQELTEQTSFHATNKAIALLKDYFVQVNPREINLFYMTETLRERIVFEAHQYRVLNTDLKFSKEEILEEVHQNPERFSPNVILRPLYQEIILPNLSYIGGGGELAYWLELKPVFEAFNVPFPMLQLRNSVLLVSEKQAKKADALNLSWQDLFTKKDVLLKQKVVEISNLDLDFSAQKAHLQQQFSALYEMASQTDISFKKAVAAQERKQIKGLENLEKKLLKAEKRKLQEHLHAIELLKNDLFPKGGLQERLYNFAYFHEQSGGKLIEKLMETLDPFTDSFMILKY